VERRLAAILAADVVGYSTLMESDEAGTFERLKAHRSEIFEPDIKLHHGRIFKLMGDGLLAEFGSVVDAVECAVAVQKAMAKHNDGLAPEKRIDLRIGVNLGDVIIEGKDRHGEGVNIAARLEQLADPGGICVSRAAHEQAKNKFAFEPMGAHKVKNIAEPIEAFRVKLDGVPAKRVAAPRVWQWQWAAALALIAILAGGGAWFMNDGAPSRAKPGLAVLPFSDLSGSAAGRRLADGITEDIITDLSRFKDLEVIARNSTEIYRGKPVDIRQVGRDLNVAYVLEGSIQAEAERVRVTGQLIDAGSGAHVWSNRWDRPAGDLFAVQSEVAGAVAAALGGSSNIGAVTQSEKEKMRRKPPASLDAYELYLIGVEAKSQPTKEAVPAGLAALDKAISLDPGFARAYGIRGWLHMFSSSFAGVAWPQAMERMGADMKKAYEIDPRDPDIIAALGFYYSMIEDKMPEADILLREAVALNPNSVHVLGLAATALPYTGHPDEAAVFADRALRLDPRMVPVNLGALSNAYFFVRRFEDTINLVIRVPEESRFQGPWLFLAASHAFLGREAEAQKAKAALLAAWPDITAQAFYEEGMYCARQQEQDLFFEAFRVLKLPMCATPEQLKSIAKPKPLPECPAVTQ
jgi:TolB-like protein/class 3 adenylate cyclase/tetratricopeptide (TPR) repeat protein